ncbi:MAG: hypothetical protein N3D11_03735 [Candidatus Sumerlaeia bacterium]|nr:hypothetical protein [Candidatus Sumerlaeia bacterium]
MDTSPLKVDRSVPDMRIELFGEDSPIRARVWTPHEQTDWTLFTADPTQEESRRVATTLEHRGVLYAIAARKAVGTYWRYDLVDWPPGELVRRKVPLSREYFEALAEEQRRQKAERRRNQQVCAWSFFIALLPARVQDYFGEEYGYDGIRWVRISSAVIGFCAAMAAFGLNIELLKQYGGSPPLSMILVCVGLFYLVLESFCRYVGTISGQHTFGLLVLELLFALGRMATKRK